MLLNIPFYNIFFFWNCVHWLLVLPVGRSRLFFVPSTMSHRTLFFEIKASLSIFRGWNSIHLLCSSKLLSFWNKKFSNITTINFVHWEMLGLSISGWSRSVWQGFFNLFVFVAVVCTSFQWAHLELEWEHLLEEGNQNLILMRTIPKCQRNCGGAVLDAISL